MNQHQQTVLPTFVTRGCRSWFARVGFWYLHIYWILSSRPPSVL